MSTRKRGLFVCPNCGAEVPENSSACPECGSDENTGWSDSVYMDGIDLPDDHDYEESLAREFGVPQTKKNKNLKKYWIMITGAVLLVLFLLGYFM